MRIRVNHNYGGKPTNNLRIRPGVYDASDPALFGLADYLVQHGHAEFVDGDTAVTFPAAEPLEVEQPLKAWPPEQQVTFDAQDAEDRKIVMTEFRDLNASDESPAVVYGLPDAEGELRYDQDETPDYDSDFDAYSGDDDLDDDVLEDDKPIKGRKKGGKS